MLTLHGDIELTCGDAWRVDGELRSADGEPLNLDPSVEIEWVLLGPDGVRVDLTDHATLERIDPVANGKVTITLDEALTSTFRPGRFTNALRVWVGDEPSTLWRGIILAGADPFWH